MRLLLAIDDSKFAEAAVHAVISQVRQDHTQVLVLHAVDWSNFMPSPFPVLGGPIFSSGQLESILKNETQRAQDLVKTAAERLRSAGQACIFTFSSDLRIACLWCCNGDLLS